MGVVNRRNAVVGWVVWNVAKRVVKRKAKAAIPSVDLESRRPNAPLIAASVLAAAGGAVGIWLWSRRGDASPGAAE